MVDLNSTIFVQMIGFLVLLFMLNIILYKPILKVIRQRRQVIDDLIAKANELKSNAFENENNYQQKLKKSETEAKQQYNEIIKEASSEKEKRLAEESAKARTIIEEQKKDIFESLDKEIEATKQHSVELSNKIYEQLVG
jgi:F-type H+-transporting ATPase subunit b